MIRSREQAERGERDVVLRQAALRRLEAISAEIDAVMERRMAAWGQLALRPSRSTTQQIKALSERLTALWSEARAMRVYVKHGERGLILDRAHREIRTGRSKGY